MIDEGAFWGSTLSTLDLSNATSLTTIENMAFNSCGLTTLTIPSNVRTIGTSAFSLNELTSLTFSNGLETIGQGAFSSNKLPSVNIPNSVITIGKSAFDYNNISTIEIGSGITEIGASAFGTTAWGHNERTWGPNVITSIRIHKNYQSLTSEMKIALYKSSSNLGKQFGNYSGNITWDDGSYSISD